MENEMTVEDVLEREKKFTGNNALIAIHPFYKNGLWVFNDERVGLVEEPFVAGADEFIEHELKKKHRLDEGKKGFNLIFSTTPFINYQYELSYDNEQSGGTVYTVVNVRDFQSSIGENKLWLCPAMNLYFEDSPEKLYVSFKFSED